MIGFWGNWAWCVETNYISIINAFSGGKLKTGLKAAAVLNLLRERVRTIQKWKFSKKSICKAMRTFTLSVGITALCMLATLGLLGLEGAPGTPAAAQAPAAEEASAFNASKAPIEKEEYPTSENQVIPLGEAFGIKLFTDGVIVASLSDIYTADGVCCPAGEAGLCPGDYLLAADGMEIQSNAALAQYIGRSQGEGITFKVRRDKEVFEAVVKPMYGEGSFKTGMWVRDSAAGVGTLTFYDPVAGTFAGLGHGICDADAGNVMTLKSGEPAGITLCGIVRGMPDEPGQLRGYFSSDEPLGRLLANNETGVYGTLNEAPEGRPVEVLSREDVHTGPVKLLASINENGPALYDGEIQKINGTDQPTKNLIVKVTDPRLLDATGGIVQGMSGAPILQDGKLAGAVTHVFTEDPTGGYGIFAETMLERCRELGQKDEANPGEQDVA